MEKPFRWSVRLSLSVVFLVAAWFAAGCSSGGGNHDYPEVDHAAEAASSVKVQVMMLNTVARQKPDTAAILIDSLVQSLAGIDEAKAGPHWGALQQIKTRADELKALCDKKATKAQIRQKAAELAKLAQPLPDEFMPKKKKK